MLALGSPLKPLPSDAHDMDLTFGLDQASLYNDFEGQVPFLPNPTNGIGWEWGVVAAITRRSIPRGCHLYLPFLVLLFRVGEGNFF